MTTAKKKQQNFQNKDYLLDILANFRRKEDEIFGGGKSGGTGKHNEFQYALGDRNKYGERRVGEKCWSTSSVRPEFENARWRQEEVSFRDRMILVDWLIYIHRKFKLLSDTLYTTVALLDVTLLKRQMRRDELQLFGSVCLWIASKYHEMYPPTSESFVTISDHAFKKDEMVETEAVIWKMLNNRLVFITPHSFESSYTKMISSAVRKKKDEKDYDKREILAKTVSYFMERCLLDWDLCNNYRPSMVAAAVCAYTVLSFRLKCRPLERNGDVNDLKNAVWSEEYVVFTGYSLEELEHVILRIEDARKCHNLHTAEKFKAIYDKYSREEYSQVAKLDFDKLGLLSIYFKK